MANELLIQALGQRRQKSLSNHLSLGDALAPDVMGWPNAGGNEELNDAPNPGDKQMGGDGDEKSDLLDRAIEDENMHDGDVSPKGAMPPEPMDEDDAVQPGKLDMGLIMGQGEAPQGLRKRAMADFKK